MKEFTSVSCCVKLPVHLMRSEHYMQSARDAVARDICTRLYDTIRKNIYLSESGNFQGTAFLNGEISVNYVANER